MTALYWPMIVQAFLTFAIYPVLLIRRRQATRSGQARWERIANGFDAPPDAYRAARNISNQYEVPVLFYIACLALVQSGGAGTFALVLAWLFALSRILHAVVHLGRNVLILRGGIFGFGFAMVVCLWLLLAIHLAG